MATARSVPVPLYIAVCLNCKDSQPSPDWTFVSRWQLGHIARPGHMVVLSQGSIHVDFVETLTKTTADPDDDDQPVSEADRG